MSSAVIGAVVVLKEKGRKVILTSKKFECALVAAAI